MTPNVIVATPIYERPTAEFLWSILHLAGRGGFVMCKGVLLENARRFLIEKALQDGHCTHVLMVDSDLSFLPDALTRLLSHNAPVVGGCYRARNPPHTPLVYESKSGYLVLRDPPTEPAPVDALPCGFMLVERRVFIDVERRAGAARWFDSILGLEPDLAFCTRAVGAGFKILCDPSIPLGHVSETVLTI